MVLFVGVDEAAVALAETPLGAKEVLARVSSERQQIRSAEFKIAVSISETLFSKDRKAKFSEEWEKWNGHCFYDSLVDSSVMRWSQTGDLSHSIKPLPENRPFASRLSPDGFAFLDPLRKPPSLEISKDHDSSPRNLIGFAPFNPQCLGIATYSKLKRGLTINETLDALLSLRGGDEPTVAIDEESGYVVIEQIYNGGTHRQKLVFDRGNSWVLLTKTNEYGRYDPGTKRFLVDRLAFEMNTTWDLVNGIVVPTKIVQKVIRPQNSQRAGAANDEVDVEETLISMAIEWQVTNETIDKTVFELENSDLPVNGIVADRRGPKTVVEQKNSRILQLKQEPSR